MAFTIIHLLHLTCWLAITGLPSNVQAVKQMNFYHKYYVEDMCSVNQSIMYILEGEELDSAAKISASRFKWLSDNRHCRITIRPPFLYGIILTVESLLLGYSSSEYECSDYIQILLADGNSTRICGHQKLGDYRSYTSEGEIQIIYHTSARGMFLRGFGFTLVATAYSRESLPCRQGFTCRNQKCIWEKFACDGINNCGDNSDEEWESLSQCHDIPEFTSKPVDFNWDLIQPTGMTGRTQNQVTTITTAVFCIFFFLMTVGLRVYCYRWNQRQDRAILRQLNHFRNRATISRHFGIGNNAAPPPYSSLITEPNDIQTSAMSDNPPPYTIAVLKEEEESSKASFEDAICVPAESFVNLASHNVDPVVARLGPPPLYVP